MHMAGGGFWDSVWGGIKKAASTVGNAVVSAGKAALPGIGKAALGAAQNLLTGGNGAYRGFKKRGRGLMRIAGGALGMPFDETDAQDTEHAPKRMRGGGFIDDSDSPMQDKELESGTISRDQLRTRFM